jgi:uncharacterized protein (DUF58 family)
VTERWSRTRWFLGGVGVALAFLGFLGLYDPALGMRFVGGGALLNAVGFLAFVLAGRALWRRGTAPRTDTTLPAVGQREGTALPGESFDRALAERDGRARERLGAVTRALLDRVDAEWPGDEDSNTDPLAAGTWTENVPAAAFFDREQAGRDGLLARFRERLRDTPTPQQRAAALVDELGDLADVDWESEEPGPRPTSGDQAFERLSTGEQLTRSTGRLEGAEAVPLVAVGLGVYGSSPALLLVAAATALALGFARSTSPPPVSLDLEHRLERDRARPGESVRVTVAVTNEADQRVPDIRLVDGVPEGLRVSAGRPSLGTTLAPGETATTTYAVEAAFGEHRFSDASVVVRDAPGATERLCVLGDESSLTCLPNLSEPSTPSPPETTPYAGQVDTTTGGAGLEFFGTRAYQHGDALARIDWKRLARTGELTTIEYREERAASVVLLIDARAGAFVAPSRTADHAVARSVSGAASLVGGLLDDGDRVGLAALSGTPCWVPPAAGSRQRARLREALGTHRAFGASPPATDVDAGAALARLRARLSAGTTVVFLTPLVDDWPPSVIQRLRADGLAVTVVSPDPTGGATVGTRLARIERATRVSALRSRGVTVVDWGREDPLELALARRSRR